MEGVVFSISHWSSLVSFRGVSCYFVDRFLGRENDDPRTPTN
jgi:hypothetical protein